MRVDRFVKYFIFMPARLLGVILIRCLPLDWMLRIFQRLTFFCGKLISLRDWKFQVRGRPKFFKHSINMAYWPFDSSRWTFSARGVYAREYVNYESKVLDLCCGDGAYSYLFFSDIAKKVDGVDADKYAIEYARKYHAATNVDYHQLDIVMQEFPDKNYDLVVWNSAICYFSKSEIELIINKIVNASNPGAFLIGVCPVANGWADHKTEFGDSSSLESYLRHFYAQVDVRKIQEKSTYSLYFRASQSLTTPRITNESK